MTVRRIRFNIFLLLYHIKTSRFYVAMIDHRRCHYAISIHLYQWHTKLWLARNFCSCHILTSPVIYCLTDAQQQRTYSKLTLLFSACWSTSKLRQQPRVSCKIVYNAFIHVYFDTKIFAYPFRRKELIFLPVWEHLCPKLSNFGTFSIWMLSSLQNGKTFGRK